jgi:hypothetical protein
MLYELAGLSYRLVGCELPALDSPRIESRIWESALDEESN